MEILHKIQKFSNKNKNNLKAKHNYFEGKLTRSFENFQTNHQNVIQKLDEKIKNTIEKPVERYEKWVILG